MKRFKITSAVFITVIAVIFGFNTYYITGLYRSIRQTVERDVMNALADADLDEMWIRAERARGATQVAIMDASTHQTAQPERYGEVSAAQDSTGNGFVTTRHPDGSISTESFEIQRRQSFTNNFVSTVGRQFHSIMDDYVPVDLAVMDSVLVQRLNDRLIYSGFVAVEVIDSVGNTILPNPRAIPVGHDSFTYDFNPASGKSYRVHMTPLTRHILSQMAGVIVTIFLLMVAFASAFWYLLHTVSRLRTIEEMKDDFVGNMTHELKTPIAIAYSANDALLNYDTGNDPSKRETYLKIANKQLKRLGELVENILAMSMERRRTMRLNLEKIQLMPFVNEIAAAQRMREDKDLTIRIEGDESVSVEADKTHLSNILNNLIDNAIKYSGDSVRIVVAVTADSISVSDNGIGIPSKSVPYIFDKFYRVPHGNRQDVSGHGIGLYYVKNIVGKLGWSISVRSKEGEGSNFTINFSKDER